MVVEKQGHMECALATIAALAGVDLSSVREVALAEANARGLKFFKHKVLDATARRVGGARMADLVGFYGCSFTGGVARISNRVRSLPAHGRGAVRFRGRGGFGHICPWENGLLYDPDQPDRPFTLREFRQLHRYSVDYITREEN